MAERNSKIIEHINPIEISGFFPSVTLTYALPERGNISVPPLERKIEYFRRTTFTPRTLHYRLVASYSLD
ncbi:hypothetical protein ACTXT7_014552 [Hymenolepis weldensis]